jgi:Prolyl oligopeptidase, N-terminal beta-propeller domain
VEDYHGTAVADPYRWMEDLDSPQTRAWVSAEGKFADEYLASIKEREPLHKRIATLYDYEKFGIPFHEGGRYFYTHNSGMQDQSVLYASRRLGDKWALVLDPNTLSPDGKLIVTDYEAARDGRHLAYGVSRDFDRAGLRISCFRDLLSVHTPYGLPARRSAKATLYTEGFSRFVTSATAPIATGWRDSCRAGLIPAGRPCLCTAHKINNLQYQTRDHSRGPSIFSRPLPLAAPRF